MEILHFHRESMRAFHIDIVKASGKNWWCVLYPPLCFVEATHGVLPEESKIH